MEKIELEFSTELKRQAQERLAKMNDGPTTDPWITLVHKGVVYEYNVLNGKFRPLSS